MIASIAPAGTQQENRKGKAKGKTVRLVQVPNIFQLIGSCQHVLLARAAVFFRCNEFVLLIEHGALLLVRT